HGPRIFLEIIGRQGIVRFADEGIEEVPGAASGETQRIDARLGERLGFFERRGNADGLRDGGRDGPENDERKSGDESARRAEAHNVADRKRAARARYPAT